MFQFVAPLPPTPAIHAPAPHVRSQAIPPDATAIVRQALAGIRPAARVACAVIGDSIALGVGESMRFCTTVATKGIGSQAISMRTPGTNGARVVISAGANDPLNPALEENLETIRSRASASRVVWNAPRHPRAGGIVARVAARHGDRVVSLYAIPTRDGTHPVSYPTLAAMVRYRLGI